MIIVSPVNYPDPDPVQKKMSYVGSEVTDNLILHVVGLNSN